MTHDNVTDIVERLRGLKWKVHCEMRGLVDDETAYEAADTIATLRKQLENARGSLYQCYRSSRNDALESHPDWAEHIADINRESGEAIVLIDEALKGQKP